MKSISCRALQLAVIVTALSVLLLVGCGDAASPSSTRGEEIAVASDETEEESAGARSPVSSRLEVIGNAGVGGTVTLRLTAVVRTEGRDPSSAANA
jgi:hypothetical protein